MLRKPIDTRRVGVGNEACQPKAPDSLPTSEGQCIPNLTAQCVSSVNVGPHQTGDVCWVLVVYHNPLYRILGR